MKITITEKGYKSDVGIDKSLLALLSVADDIAEKGNMTLRKLVSIYLNAKRKGLKNEKNKTN